MAKKVYLSPSDQSRNAYAYGSTNEAEQCGKIAEAAKTALVRCGVEVKIGHMISMAEKCAQSNAYGAELHVPIHTNAYNGKVSGTRMFCYNSTGDGYKACKAIFDAVAPITPGKSENIKVDDELYEVRVPAAPTAYLECEFHDNKDSAKWIVEHTTELGEAIARGICNYFGIAYKTEDEKTSDKPDEGKDEIEVQMRTLKRGMSGDDVRNAMLILKDRGYYKGEISKSDKLFGPKMEAAVIAAQKANGFGADGVIGYQMLPWLYQA